MFELYFILFTNFIKSAEFISRNDIPILKQTTDDIYTLANHDEYKLIFFGESPSVLNLFRYFMGCGDFSQNDARGPKIDPPSNKNSLRHSTIIHSEFTDLILNSKIEILENIGDKLFSAISEAISLHCNPRILKDYISIMADLCYNLVRSDFQEHYAKLLKYYLKFLKRLLMQNCGLNRATNKYYESSTKPTILSSKFERLPYPVEIIRINSSSSDYSLRNCHVEFEEFNFEKESIIVKAYFKIHQDSHFYQEIVRIEDSKNTFSIVIKIDDSTQKKNYIGIKKKHELIKKDSHRIILITLEKKEYFDWINIECTIINKDKCKIDYLDIRREEFTSKENKAVYKSLELPIDKSMINNQIKSSGDMKRQLGLRTHLFPLFKGDLSFLGVYRECCCTAKQENKQSKRNWIQRKFGFIKEAPQLDENIIEQLDSSNMFNFNKHTSYSDFLAANLEESSKRNLEKIIQLYPKNCYLFSKLLNSKTEVFTFQHSRPLIISMGGMNLLKPLINTVLQFNHSYFEGIHEELFEVADAIGDFSSSLYRYFILHLEKINKVYLKDGKSINKKILDRFSTINQIDLLSVISRGVRVINPSKSNDSKKTISAEGSSQSINDDSTDSKKSRKAQKSNIISQYIIQLVDFYLNDLEQREGAQKEDDQKKSILTNIDRIEYYLRMIDLLNVEKEDYRLESEEQNTSYFCLCDDLSCKFLEKYK